MDRPFSPDTAPVLYVASSNPGKQASFRRALSPQITVGRVDVWVPEPQTTNVGVIAAVKAVTAWMSTGLPVVTEDGGLALDALHGFPGAYTKDFLDMVPLQRIVDLTHHPVENTRCRFQSAVATVADRHLYLVTGDSRTGHIADQVSPTIRMEAWSPLWRVFIPDGFDTPLADCYPTYLTRHLAGLLPPAPLDEFCRWVKTGVPPVRATVQRWPVDQLPEQIARFLPPTP